MNCILRELLRIVSAIFYIIIYVIGFGLVGCLVGLVLRLILHPFFRSLDYNAIGTPIVVAFACAGALVAVYVCIRERFALGGGMLDDLANYIMSLFEDDNEEEGDGE